MSTGGKGSASRPIKVSQEIFSLRRDLVWGTDKQKDSARTRLRALGVANV